MSDVTESVSDSSDDLLVVDGDLRLRARRHVDGRRVVASVDRRVAWGWTGVSAVCGLPGEIVGWVAEDDRWPIERLVAALGVWVSRLVLEQSDSADSERFALRHAR